MGQDESLGVDRLLALIETQNRIAAAKLDVDGVMQLVVERATALTTAKGAVIEVADGDEMVYRCASGTAASSVGLRLKQSSSLSGLCVAKNEALICEDAATDPRVDKEACRRVGVSSMICVPLHHDARPVGVLKVLSPVAHAFGAGDVKLLGLLAGVVAASMAHAQAFESRDREVRTDALTGLPNRLAYDERLASECRLSKELGRPLSLALLDLDGFQGVNARGGRSEGDRILMVVSALLGEEIDEMDTCFRIGGDEFAILMPNTRADDAVEVIKRCGEAVRDAELAKGAIGISAGVAESDGESPGDFHARADRRLHLAKNEGKSEASSKKRDYQMSFPPSLRAPPIG